MTTVKVDIATPLTINKYTFVNRANATLYVPKGCKAAYEKAEFWKEFHKIAEIVNADINGDNDISIADCSALVNIVLGADDQEPYLYDHELADINGDGSITIADVTTLVNIILGK